LLYLATGGIGAYFHHAVAVVAAAVASEVISLCTRPLQIKLIRRAVTVGAAVVSKVDSLCARPVTIDYIGNRNK